MENSSCRSSIMSEYQLPLLPDPPPYPGITAFPLPKGKGFDHPPPYPDVHTVAGNTERLQIPEGFDLYWSSVFVYGPERKPASIREKCFSRQQRRRKEILHKVSGVAQAGRLLAIMGSSGAGKTTLLNVLTSRNLAGLDVHGVVTVDGLRVSKWKLREISAFVQQQDMFIGTMTAREHLRFMAKLRMGSAYTKMEQNHRVEEVIRKMGLSGCADTMIGIPNSVKGLSCGEMKRLAFASEILTCPKILFCDEPTSGLDAFMAGHVVAALRALADGGMTVVITIHQPSSQVYSLFNDVCLMACGRIIYLGPTEDAHPLFESCGYPCPEYYNPADHLIRTLAIINGERSTCLQTISRIRQGFLQTPNGKRVLEISEKQIADKRYSDESYSNKNDQTFFNMKHPASFLGQLSALTWRSWLTIVRDPMVLKIRLIQTIAITMELPIVLRENTNGIYTTTSYFIGKNIAELPQYIILPAIYNLIVYWMAAYAVATVFGSTDVAMTFLPIFVVPMMAFGGFFITYDAIPFYFTWLSQLSYFKYSYEALAINEWETVDMIPGCLNHTLKISNCPKSGAEVLEQIDFDGFSKWMDVLILVAMQPRKYVIDLDAPASERWNEVVHDHLDAIPEFVKVAQSYVPKQLLPIAFWIAGELNRFFPEEYADEIRGIAKASGLPLGLVVSMNILYDILAFDRKHVFQLGCTSIVAQSEDGVIYHGRNLDYDMGDLLKNITILVDFTRGQGDERPRIFVSRNMRTY
ncbi:ABC transporter, ATP-binding protein [Ancylostoma ceylanicum]|uniref:ABC transporter, ATP-binding protein n=1 Tax=Ancylostoma ceylanicum TaxID=53326 RepID=A0A0D6MAF8_9BILA|nr:ABC transporter, ATP-binding protein [Ancylostoma ceylanicum]